MEGKNSNKVIHKRVKTLDKFSRKMFTLIEPCCCILCRRVEEDLDHTFFALAALLGLFVVSF